MQLRVHPLQQRQPACCRRLTCTASVMLSTTTMSAAALCSAVARARRRSFLFILMLQSLGCSTGRLHKQQEKDGATAAGPGGQ